MEAQNQPSSSQLLTEQLTFLRLELTLLDGKMKQIVDRLWQIRALCITLWSGVVAIGLGIGKDGRPIPALLLLSALFPIWFSWVDSTYQRWYRRFRAREDAISDFVHNPSYKLPSTGAQVSLIASLESGAMDFPVLDLYGDATFGKDNPRLRWYTSRLSNMADSTPLVVYGIQLIASTVLIALKALADWRIAPLVLITVVLLFIVSVWGKKRRMLSDSSTVFADAEWT